MVLSLGDIKFLPAGCISATDRVGCVFSPPRCSVHLLVYVLTINIRFWEMTKCGSELRQAKLIPDSQSRSSNREAVASCAVFSLAAFCSLKRATPTGTFCETPVAVNVYSVCADIY